jgi:ATP-dependent Clp protease adaptor protein ClpS
VTVSGEPVRGRVASPLETLPTETAPPEVLPTDTEGEVDLSQSSSTDRPWLVIVWNDPVNLMTYVVYVLQKLFGYSREKATRLMLQVHHDGKAVVSDGTREKAEADVARLHGHGLWATMEHAS